MFADILLILSINSRNVDNRELIIVNSPKLAALIISLLFSNEDT